MPNLVTSNDSLNTLWGHLFCWKQWCAGAHTHTHMHNSPSPVSPWAIIFYYISLSWFTSENCDCFCCIERETNTAGPAVSSQGVHHEASSCLGKWLCHDLDSLFVCKLTLFRKCFGRSLEGEQSASARCWVYNTLFSHCQHFFFFFLLLIRLLQY